MSGLRKVVKLKIYDIREEDVKLNREFVFYWRNYIYFNDILLDKSKRYDSRKKQLLGKSEDELLKELISKATKKEKKLEENLDINEFLITYNNEKTGSSIQYFGGHVDLIKKKILERKN